MTHPSQNETYMVANDYMNFCIGNDGAPPSESAKAMRSLAKKLEDTHGSSMHALVQQFLAASGHDPWTGLRNMMSKMTGDGRLNWGRVVSLFVFMGILASELCSRGQDAGCCGRLAEMIVEFLHGENREWLIQNGGWGGFINSVHKAGPAEQDSPMRKALYAVAGVGLAGITFLLVR